MKYDIIISGVGGQGILSISTVLGRAALKQGLRLKQSEVHGMAQRGGAVQSHLRMADEPIHSDVIPHAGADMILGMEPMESLRYLKWLAPEGWLISNTEPVENIEAYPDVAELHTEIDKWDRSLLFDGAALARDAGSVRALNMVMLGAGSPFIPIPDAILEDGIREQFGPKGQKIVEINISAFRSARDLAITKKESLNTEH